MTIHTVSSLRNTHRRLAKRVGRLERAQAVLDAMRAGATLHLFNAKQRRWWTLSTGEEVHRDVAKLVIASSSVVGVGDALFRDVPGQTWRWWRE
jgi:hypothetical protein